MIRREASQIIGHELKDPRIGFITVTKATITEDLRNAVIYYSVLGDERAHKQARAAFKSALVYLRAELGHRLELRYTPEFILKEDEGLKYTQKIEDTLKKIKEEKEGGAHAD